MTSPERPKALVTGAGSGIGAATAVALMEIGFDVALCGRRPSGLERVAARAPLLAREARIVVADLADRAATDRALDGLLATWPALDAVVLNAGINEMTPLAAPDTAAFDRVLEVDLVANFRLLRRLVPALREGGRIVVIGSVLGRFGIPNGHGYCAAKAGVAGLVRALALDLAPKKITVNAVMPGWVDTPMADAAITTQAPGLGMTGDAARAMFAKAVPIGRFLAPLEVARYVQFLVGSQAGGVTGQAVNLCGGTLA